MIIRDWETFRRLFGFSATQATTATTFTYIAGGASNDTIRRGVGTWDLDGFIDAESIAVPWLDVSDTKPHAQAAIQEDGGAFTDFTTAAQNVTVDDVDLLPAAPAADDAFYVGAERVFDRIGLTLSTPGAGTWVIAWEYWDGDNWTSLDFAYHATSAQMFDDDTGIRLDETEDASSLLTADVTLLPTIGDIEIGDAFYVGSSTQFGAVDWVTTVDCTSEGWAITWEYWDGLAWTSLAGVTDGTADLQAIGASRLTFTVPTAWESTVVSAEAQSLYYVRGRVTTAQVAPTLRPVATTVFPVRLVDDESAGLTTGATPEVVFVTPDNWATTTVNGQGAYYYARGRVSSYTSITTQPLAAEVFVPGANDGAYPTDIDADFLTDTIEIDNATYPEVARLMPEATAAGNAGHILRHLDRADGVEHWRLDNVRLAASSFGDVLSTMTGVTLPVSPLTGSNMTCNAGAADATPSVDEYDWFVSQQTPVDAARFLTIAETVLPDGITPVSGTINVVASAIAISELGIVTANGFTSLQIANVYRDCVAYVQRRSDNAVQLVHLERATTSGEQ